jgi:hypothetical protein
MLSTLQIFTFLFNVLPIKTGLLIDKNLPLIFFTDLGIYFTKIWMRCQKKSHRRSFFIFLVERQARHSYLCKWISRPILLGCMQREVIISLRLVPKGSELV